MPPTSAPSTTRGARSCQRIALVGRRERRVDVQRTARARPPRARSTRAPMCTGPTASPTGTLASRKMPRRDDRQRAGGRRSALLRPPLPRPAAQLRGSLAFVAPHSADALRHGTHEVDDPRAPARGDVVADARRRRRSSRPRSCSSPAACADRRRRLRRSTSCRRGRSGRDRRRRCTRPRASGTRSRSCRRRRRCPAGRAA